MADNRKICVMVGGCYMSQFAHLLLRHDGFRRDYRLTMSDAIGTPNPRRDFPKLPLAEASVLIYQPPICWARGWGDNGELYREFLETTPRNAYRIAIPAARFHAFWPNHHHDPVRATAVFHHMDELNLLYLYGDAYVIRMVEQGMPPGDIIENYRKVDLSNLIDLDRVKDISIAHQRAMETETDVKCLDFIRETYKSEQLFVNINHVSNRVLLYIVNGILKKLDYKILSYNLLNELSLLNPPEIPIHHSVIRYFNLKWATPEMRYQIGRFRRLTFDEYVYQIATAYDLVTSAVA